MVPLQAFAFYLAPLPIELSDLTVTDPHIFIKKEGHLNPSRYVIGCLLRFTRCLDHHLAIVLEYLDP